MEDIKTALRAALVSRFGVKKAILNDQMELFSSGLVDSLSVMELVSIVETISGSSVAPTDITLENFDSIDRIMRYVTGAKAKESAS
jgi:acyl carrier protein